jgi:hypothetical protein
MHGVVILSELAPSSLATKVGLPKEATKMQMAWTTLAPTRRADMLIKLLVARSKEIA